MTLKKAFLLLFLALAWLIGGVALSASLFDPAHDSMMENILGAITLLGFSILMLAGTTVWAGAKDYDPIVGFVLGWLGPLGLLILACLPDHSRIQESHTAQDES